MRPPFLAFMGMIAIAVTSSLSAGCSCNPACQFRGTINQPDKLSMRRSMLRKAMGDVCKQMTSRNAPLRLNPEAPVIGRFYPKQCLATEGDQLGLTFSGFGYAWTNVTKKLTFTSSGAAAYRYDFQVTEGDKCDVYAYFRPARVDGSDFRTYRIEAGAASLFNAFTNVGDNFGRQLVSQKVKDGFTVIAYDGSETNTDFSLGLVPLGQKPFRPFQVHGNDRITIENERSEVHQNERDYVGPIVVEDVGRAIYLTARVDGAPAIDVMLLNQMQGEAALRDVYEIPQAVPLAMPPMAGMVVPAGQEIRRTFVVTPGTYYLVFDNTPTAGQVSPPVTAFDDRAAVVSYLIQIGDAS